MFDLARDVNNIKCGTCFDTGFIRTAHADAENGPEYDAVDAVPCGCAQGRKAAQIIAVLNGGCGACGYEDVEYDAATDAICCPACGATYVGAAVIDADDLAYDAWLAHEQMQRATGAAQAWMESALPDSWLGELSA